MQKDLYKRLAKIEAMTNAQKAELEETLVAAYEAACTDRNEEAAAALARKIRNKLLDSSDKQMTLDRLGLDLSSATKFIAALSAIFTGAWAKYRQALRDLPEQAGFPFEIEFPVAPDSEEDSENEPV